MDRDTGLDGGGRSLYLVNNHHRIHDNLMSLHVMYVLWTKFTSIVVKLLLEDMVEVLLALVPLMRHYLCSGINY